MAGFKSEQARGCVIQPLSGAALVKFTVSLALIVPVLVGVPRGLKVLAVRANHGGPLYEIHGTSPPPF